MDTFGHGRTSNHGSHGFRIVLGVRCKSIACEIPGEWYGERRDLDGLIASLLLRCGVGGG